MPITDAGTTDAALGSNPVPTIVTGVTGAMVAVTTGRPIYIRRGQPLPETSAPGEVDRLGALGVFGPYRGLATTVADEVERVVRAEVADALAAEVVAPSAEPSGAKRTGKRPPKLPPAVADAVGAEPALTAPTVLPSSAVEMPHGDPDALPPL